MRTMLIVLCVAILGSGLVAMIGKNSPSTIATMAATSTGPTSTPAQLKLAETCKNTIHDKTVVNFWRRYDSSGKFTTVIVNPEFYSLSFENRSLLNDALRCVVTDGRMDNSIDYVSYEDPRTHAEIGHWSSAMGLEFER